MNWPNRLSLLRVGLVPLIVLMIIIGASWSYGVALALFLVGGLTDWADGWMARRYRIVTNFGKFMDPVADKLLVLSTMISLCGQGLIPSWACVVVLFRAERHRLASCSGAELDASGGGHGHDAVERRGLFPEEPRAVCRRPALTGPV
mgnify:CR=1 FL=1